MQEGDPYALAIPVAVTLEGRDKAMQMGVRATERETTFVLMVPARPLRLDVDPEFDLFRKLDVEEAPPALSGAFGADPCTMILPAKADAAMLAAYRAMAAEWNTGRASPMTIVNDDALTALPSAGSIWLVGFENRFIAAATDAPRPYGAKAAPDAARARVIVGAPHAGTGAGDRVRGRGPRGAGAGARRASSRTTTSTPTWRSKGTSRSTSTKAAGP